jgi:hypothetical protein
VVDWVMTPAIEQEKWSMKVDFSRFRVENRAEVVESINSVR